MQQYLCECGSRLTLANQYMEMTPGGDWIRLDDYKCFGACAIVMTDADQDDRDNANADIY